MDIDIDIKIDLDRCVGSGVCEALAPATFEVGDDGQAHVLGDRDDPVEIAAARDRCPTEAITTSGD